LSLSITTIVRDAGHLGGGIVNVARPLHLGLMGLGADASFVSGNRPFEAIAKAYAVGMGGKGFTKLPAPMMRSIVHIHGIWTPFEYNAFREARRRGARIAMSPHGALEPWAFNHKWAKKRIAWWIYQKRLLQSADILIVNSGQELRRLRSLGLRPPIATIANGVDLEGLPAFEDMKAERERIVLFFSRIDPKKGVPDLINAWISLQDHKGYCLHIHGHGEEAYVAKIRQLIATSGASDIKLLPPVFGAARWEIFENASIYVLPSYSENFGITVAEALTAGLPVITTRATPWSDLTNAGLGWIVGNDIKQLRNALEASMLVDSTHMSVLREKAKSYARQHFAWETITQRYAETYAWLSAQHTPAPAWIDH